LYRPHRASGRARLRGALARLFAPGPPPAADPAAPAARRSVMPWIGLVAAEFRLIGAGRPFHVLAVITAASGVLADYRHIGSPAALLLLIFGLVAHAGRSEARGLLALTATAPLAPIARRIAFVAAGAGWSSLLALPATLDHLSPEPLLLALVTGGGASLAAMTLATISRSAFAPRLVLLVFWYGYLSS
jgi:hypothetical protein